MHVMCSHPYLDKQVNVLKRKLRLSTKQDTLIVYRYSSSPLEKPLSRETTPQLRPYFSDTKTFFYT